MQIDFDIAKLVPSLKPKAEVDIWLYTASYKKSTWRYNFSGIGPI